MLFRTFEPGILLACKEIRTQCLPVYYGSNAFSWRLFWLYPRDSLFKFEKWVEVVGEHAKHMRQISFEGRHAVEEGIEFEVDIDLLDDKPYYHVESDCIHPCDEITDATTEAIQQQFVNILSGFSAKDGGMITLTTARLAFLGKSFCEALMQDPGIMVSRGQWDDVM